MKYLLPLLLISTSVFAQENSNCTTNSNLHNLLTQKYGEKPFVQMKDGNGRQLIMYVSPVTGSWTVIATSGDTSCGLASGDEFSPVDADRFKVEPKKEPS